MTDWNRDRRFQGQSDIPLNDEGRAQATALAYALRDEPFDRIVSSDLSRAYDTASALARRGPLPIEPDARWREFAFGAWEGLTWEQIVQRDPNLRGDRALQPAYYTPEGGESFADVCTRVAEAIRDLRGRSESNVLIATHAGPLHAALHVLFGEEEGPTGAGARGLRLHPASITRVTLRDNSAELTTLNDIAHLEARST